MPLIRAGIPDQKVQCRQLLLAGSYVWPEIPATRGASEVKRLD